MSVDWRHRMVHQMQQLRDETDDLAQRMEARLTALRSDVRREFDEQRRINEELKADVDAMRGRVEDLGRSQARQAASFDKSLAGMVDDYSRHRSATGVIWGSLLERTGETAVDIELVKRETADLRRRIEAIEKKLAG